MRGLHTNENMIFFRKKNKVQMQTKIKIIYLNADFWLYFDLKQIHPFYQK